MIPSIDARVHHITLIRPARVVSSGTWSVPLTPPLGLAYIAAVLVEAGHDVAAIDAMAEGLTQTIEEDGYWYQGLPIDAVVAEIDPRTTMVGVSCMFSQEWPWIARLIAAVRERCPDALIVAGGEHVTALPEFSLRDCPALDVCVLGEGEETIVALAASRRSTTELASVPGLAFLDGDRYVKTAPRDRISAPERLPYPAWHLFPVDLYLSNTNTFGVYKGRGLPILATRGCPYQCTFCSNVSMYGTQWKPRPPVDVVDEIEYYVDHYEVENIDFYDLTMILKKEWILEFCDELERRRVSVVWQLPSGTRAEVIDDEVAAALYRTGCRHLVLAPESGSMRVLEAVKKRVNLDSLERAVRVARRHGLTVKTNMVIGFPDETRADVLRSVVLAWRQAMWDVDATSFMMFTPYPGTVLFDQLRADGRIGAIDSDYFRSLAVYLDPWKRTTFSRHMSGLELAAWRLAGMGSFFALALALRPAKLVRLVSNVVQNKCETMLEHRLREWLGYATPQPAR